MSTVDHMILAIETFRSLENALKDRRETLVFQKGLHAHGTDKLQAYKVFRLVEQSYNQLIVAVAKGIVETYNDDGTLKEATQ